MTTTSAPTDGPVLGPGRPAPVGTAGPGDAGRRPTWATTRAGPPAPAGGSNTAPPGAGSPPPVWAERGGPFSRRPSARVPVGGVWGGGSTRRVAGSVTRPVVE